jgi:hypothetical protein
MCTIESIAKIFATGTKISGFANNISAFSLLMHAVNLYNGFASCDMLAKTNKE